MHEARAGRQEAFCIFYGFEFNPGTNGIQRLSHQLTDRLGPVRSCELSWGVRQTLKLNSLNYPFVVVGRLLFAFVAFLRGCGSGVHGPGGAVSTGNPPVTCKQNITHRELPPAAVASVCMKQLSDNIRFTGVTLRLFGWMYPVRNYKTRRGVPFLDGLRVRLLFLQVRTS